MDTMRASETPEKQWEALIHGTWRQVSREYLRFHTIGTKELQAYRQLRISAETKLELACVESYLQEHKQRETERWTWIAKAFEQAFQEGK